MQCASLDRRAAAFHLSTGMTLRLIEYLGFA